MKAVSRCLGLNLCVALSAFGLLTSSAFADNGRRDSSFSLDQRVERLERQLNETNRLVYQLQNRLDQIQGPNFPPPYVAPFSACMLTDSVFSKVFLGVGKGRMDAEYSARQACQSTINASYCSNNLRCDDNQQSPYASFSCLVTDSVFGKVFRGEGRTPIEAEAKAKQECQKSVNPNFCGGVQARCAQNN